MRLFPVLLAAALIALGAAAAAQRQDAFVQSRNHAAIAYDKTPGADRVVALNRRIQAGEVDLAFDPASGYLRSLLTALSVPVESQTLVFSQTSFQADLININNPRALYFNDNVAVGWVRGGEVLEVAAHDAKQGVLFYQLEQKRAARPQLTRNVQCLSCHLSWDTLGVPGLFVMTMYPLPDDPNAYANGFPNNHNSPFSERWGGWYVTGEHGAARHMGNIPVMPADKGKSKLTAPLRPLKSVEGLFDLKGYPSPHSDVVALMVLNHQTHMTNLMTRIAWEARVAAHDKAADGAARVQAAASDLVDYMLFVDEARPTSPVRGSSGFAAAFAAGGPRDTKGRSLRELDLQRRLMRYPCSYMIYSEAFDAMPAAAKDAVYNRMWQVLSGRERNPRYMRLSVADRRAVLEILRDTKKGLPSYFTVTVQ
jgi:hypothetical protein